MKIYTKKGDLGKTSLFGGAKTDKSDIRINAYGTVDELNSAIGVVLTHNLTEMGQKILTQAQNDLFVIGADLATLNPDKARIDRIDKQQIEKLEEAIDIMEEDLSPLKSFILPGGSASGAQLHFARTVCRRAERETVALSKNDEVYPDNIVYLNRLSDLLFVLARYENKFNGENETPWIPK